MLYHFLYPLKSYWSVLNLFQYITFRSAMAAIVALLISFIFGPKVIHMLNVHHIGEKIRSTGPKTHQRKQGTPTMGGVLIILAVLLPTLLLADLTSPFIQIILFSTIWMGFIGFLDDYLKVILKIEKGLIARYKLMGQLILGIVISYWIFSHGNWNEIYSHIPVPFFKNYNLDFGILYPLVIIFVITGTSNAVNLTDGLDGLAAGLLAISFTVFGAIAYLSGRVDFSDYLNIYYLPGAGELFIFTSAMAGACLGFLWFNSAPAQVFMGDVGSLSTGAALGTIAILLKKELLLVIIGGVFVWEAMSVLLQVGYFKWTKKMKGEGKRLLNMSPIHHHFELAGWHETKVVVRFWIIGILLALFSLTTFKIR